MVVMFVIVAVVYALLLELSLNTWVGWAAFAAAMILFPVFYMRVAAEKSLLLRLGAWIVLFGILFVVYRISYPPYALVPAVRGKNPEPTGVVTVAQGDLTGVYDESRAVEVYTGIPYAKPPVGELRWKEPQQAEGWDGVRVCDHFAPRFMQGENSTLWDSLVMLVIYNHFNWFNPNDNYRETMSEDALYVNIWKPAGDVTDCPVLFFIHGGSLQTGTPSYDQYNGEAYAKRGIVYVDFAYRLNIFGYYADETLAAESPHDTTGNYGLLDQIAALQWVHDNIGAFGGDPDNITIAGESAGSSSVNALCVSPLAKGLFRRAIGESSGIAVNHPYHTFRPLEDALEMKQQVYDITGVSDIDALRAIDAATLVNARGAYNSMTVDGYAIPEQPAAVYQKGENNEEALLNGYNEAEADVFTILGTKVTPGNYEDILREKLGDTAAEGLAALYPAGDAPKKQYNTVVGAAWFAYSHHVWSRYMAREGRPAWLYRFTRRNRGLSTNHAGELPYFYGNLQTQPQNYEAYDYELSETIMDYIENFVRYGNPNGDGLPVWQDFSEDETLLLELGDSVEMTVDPYPALYEILDRAQEE
ncbi:MAG: carboxylesterase family protein [Lachnospiraceae bacterium]|nr:carboxylesterase family protein [Lachnospiraceae bacterium]